MYLKKLKERERERESAKNSVSRADISFEEYRKKPVGINYLYKCKPNKYRLMIVYANIRLIINNNK